MSCSEAVLFRDAAAAAAAYFKKRMKAHLPTVQLCCFKTALLRKSQTAPAAGALVTYLTSCTSGQNKSFPALGPWQQLIFHSDIGHHCFTDRGLVPTCLQCTAFALLFCVFDTIAVLWLCRRYASSLVLCAVFAFLSGGLSSSPVWSYFSCICFLAQTRWCIQAADLSSGEIWICRFLFSWRL